ncbi:MAG: hypothetical protein H6651_04190 [Ardenticatenales bacterium]|nr:hypothetical protein [Ardenticatenales bacterium]
MHLAGTAGVGGPLLPYLPAAEGLLSMLTMPVDQKLLARMPVLRVVSNMAVGVNNIDLDACTARGIPVGHTPGLLTDACADLTLALLLVVGRGLPTAARMAREGQWHTWRPTQWLGSDFRGKRLGIVGMGRIGEGVAERAKAFGMEIVYYNRSQNEEAEKRLGGAAYLTLDELLATSDFVSLHTLLTDETHQSDRRAAVAPDAVPCGPDQPGPGAGGGHRGVAAGAARRLDCAGRPDDRSRAVAA